MLKVRKSVFRTAAACCVVALVATVSVRGDEPPPGEAETPDRPAAPLTNLSQESGVIEIGVDVVASYTETSQFNVAHTARKAWVRKVAGKTPTQ